MFSKAVPVLCVLLLQGCYAARNIGCSLTTARADGYYECMGVSQYSEDDNEASLDVEPKAKASKPAKRKKPRFTAAYNGVTDLAGKTGVGDGYELGGYVMRNMLLDLSGYHMSSRNGRYDATLTALSAKMLLTHGGYFKVGLGLRESQEGYDFRTRDGEFQETPGVVLKTETTGALWAAGAEWHGEYLKVGGEVEAFRPLSVSEKSVERDDATATLSDSSYERRSLFLMRDSLTLKVVLGIDF